MTTPERKLQIAEEFEKKLFYRPSMGFGENTSPLDIREHNTKVIQDAITAAMQGEGMGEAESDGPYVEDDGCPTEKSVLQRFWREHQKAQLTAQDKTQINKRVQARYDFLMERHQHGHYETMFKCVHEELALQAATHPPASANPVTPSPSVAKIVSEIYSLFARQYGEPLTESTLTGYIQGAIDAAVVEARKPLTMTASIKLIESNVALQARNAALEEALKDVQSIADNGADMTQQNLRYLQIFNLVKNALTNKEAV